MKSKGETPSKAKNHPLKRQGMLSSGRKKLMQRKEQLRQRANKTDTKTMESKAKGALLKSNRGKTTKRGRQSNSNKSPYCIPFICFTRISWANQRSQTQYKEKNTHQCLALKRRKKPKFSSNARQRYKRKTKEQSKTKPGAITEGGSTKKPRKAKQKSPEKPRNQKEYP